MVQPGMKKKAVIIVLIIPVFAALALAQAPATAKKAKTPPTTTSRGPSTAAKSAPVDINSVTKDELVALPEIGEVDAQKIIDNRPYKR